MLMEQALLVNHLKYVQDVRAAGIDLSGCASLLGFPKCFAEVV
jgi:hypothetical protein